MLIEINDYYRLSSDSLNVNIESRSDREPDEKSPKAFTQWKAIKHYPNIETACSALITRLTNESEATNIRELIEEVKRHKNDIIEGVKRCSSG